MCSVISPEKNIYLNMMLEMVGVEMVAFSLGSGNLDRLLKASALPWLGSKAIAIELPSSIPIASMCVYVCSR